MNRTKIVSFLFLSAFLILFQHTNYVEAATLSQYATVIDTPVNNLQIVNSNVINIKGWAVNSSGIKNVQVLMDGKFLIGAQYNISSDINKC